MVLSFLPASFIDCSVDTNKLSMAFLSAVFELSFVDRAIWPFKSSNSMVLSKGPGSGVFGVARCNKHALSVIFAFIPVALISGKIAKGENAISMSISFLPFPLILTVVSVDDDALALRISIDQHAFVSGPIWKLYKAMRVFEVLGLCLGTSVLSQLSILDDELL